MIYIEINKGENLEKALKIYKNKIKSTKQTERIRKKQEFVKKSVIKRNMINKAKYKQKFINND
jgi:small subunit ribosomal protein S21